MRIVQAMIHHQSSSPKRSAHDDLAVLLMRGRLHEIYAEVADEAAGAAGFGSALATNLIEPGQPILWLRTRSAASLGGLFHANGWAELGGVPDILMGELPNSVALLRATVDALRCATLGAVILESWGALRELDLTASRRLALAAEKSGVLLLVLRIGAEPVPSAAQTRWQVASAPSRALPGNAPGLPCFDVTLLRQRGGPAGMAWRLEWDRDRRIFREAPLHGAVVPVSADGPATAGAGWGHARGRSAA